MAIVERLDVPETARRTRRWVGRQSPAVACDHVDAAAGDPHGCKDGPPSELPVCADDSRIAAAEERPRRIVFVGNSHTYQPKELGGVPKVVERLAMSTAGCGLQCESLVQGGADLLDLWDQFEARMGQTCDDNPVYAIVLQVGRDADPHRRFAICEALHHRYAPLILGLRGGAARVVLYQTWSGPHPEPGEASLLTESVESYRAALLGAGVAEVLLARVGHAFLAVRAGTAADRHIYPALFKDDSGHGSALAGVLVAAVIVQTLDIKPPAGHPQRPLGRILESMLPNAWRTASSGYADEADVGQKGWLEVKKGGIPQGLLDDPDEDTGPLSRYPPGMRTERRDLGLLPGDTLAAAAASVAGPAPSVLEPLDPDTNRDRHLHRAAGSLAQEISSAAAPAPSARRWRR